MQITCASLVNCFETISNCEVVEQKKRKRTRMQSANGRGEWRRTILIYRLKRKLWPVYFLILIYSLKIYFQFQGNNSTRSACSIFDPYILTQAAPTENNREEKSVVGFRKCTTMPQTKPHSHTHTHIQL